MEFRLDFSFRIVMDVIYYAVNLLFYKLVFLQTNLLAGWNEAQVMVFVAGYLVLDAVFMTVFSNNMWWLPIFINRGDLDYYLLRPVSSLFFLSLRDFAANSFMNLLIAAVIFIWAIARYPQPFSAAQAGLYLLLILNGTFLYYLLSMFLLIPVFWTHSGRGFQQIIWSFQRLMERPDRIFSGWVRRMLVTILPFALMASFPARIFLEGLQPRLLLHIGAVTAIFFATVVMFWRFALRSYSSASS